MNRRAALLLPLSFLLLGAKKPDALTTSVGPSISPPADVFLRNAFDTDPSRYVGRFIKDGVVAPDESSASKKTCSQYVKWVKVGGGEVKYDELFTVSSAASLKLGVPPIVSLGAGYEGASVVRVTYTLTNKIIGDIEDPEAFESCCKVAPDQCTQRYVGEFLEGTGSVWFANSDSGGGKLGAAAVIEGVPVNGSLEVSHGVSWKKSIEFPNPVYFAFKTTETGISGTETFPDNWPDVVPKSSQGTYYVGVSQVVQDEAMARDMAMTHARSQLVKYLGESISTGSSNSTTTSGDIDRLRSKMKDSRFLDSASSGLARFLSASTYKVKTIPTPDGTTYQVWVLAFISKADLEAARVEILRLSTL